MENAASRSADARQNQPAPEPISAGDQERFLSILNFWHKLEFFIPFDLDQRLTEIDEKKTLYVHRQDLQQGCCNLWRPEVEDDQEVTGFRLYVCIFDKSEITRVCDQVLGSSRTTNDDEDFERTELEGRSCFAQLTFDSIGELIFESATRSSPVSYVSTLPWALGQIQSSGLAALTSEGFNHAKQTLAERLLNFKATRELPNEHGSDKQAKPLTQSDILELHAIIKGWAGFSLPEAELIGILETRTEKKVRKGAAQEKTDEPIESDTVRPELKPDIAILNSFFLQDIESAIESVKSGRIGQPLRDYLSPLTSADRIDLESTSGLRTLLETLHPARVNHGRWFSNAHQPMTLMQQFAINSVLQDSSNALALFSVNGPPGTGKTTLLQDIFADLVVRRARVLAKLRKARDAFLPTPRRVSFNGKNSWLVSILRPELTGFEMVVASSNNAAVENISGDLPKGDKLRSNWPEAAYLKPVAYKIVAQQEDGTCKRLAKSEEPWGLISCALGNSRNRTRFKERFFNSQMPEKEKAFWQMEDWPRTITEWIESYRGPSFAVAAAGFQKKDQAVQITRGRLSSLANNVHDALAANSEDKISSIRLRIAECRSEWSACRKEKQKRADTIDQLQAYLKELVEEDRLLVLSHPEWWARLRRTSDAKLHKVRVIENARTQLRVRRELSALRTPQADEESHLAELSEKLGRLEGECEQAQAEKTARDQRLETHGSAFPHACLPNRLDDLQADEFQKSGLWHDPSFAQQRSELFAAALTLHEAWLASVGKSKHGFLPNIYAVRDLLSRGRLDHTSDALAIWQSLFLMVPIVSTTFASFHAQFADLGAASLGWLFIDEAGQAVPQAAVGAIWRAKRAVVIGDPLQIEPVFTLPSRFTSAVAALSSVTENGDYSPNKTSVQRLADEANRFGVNLRQSNGKTIWVGSPLRVHRRCIDPMFNWSNEIAYQGKMVFGLEKRTQPNGAPIPCESVWIDIKGRVSKRQNVPEQTRFVLDLLLTLYRMDQTLPALYIISPFKAIKTEITEKVLKLDWIEEARNIQKPKRKDLEKWCRERVGTVHTFQGKEEHSVLMVLGGDAQHVGSVDWACSKPNILNVALTRARMRFYVVGDRELWGAKEPFNWSLKHDFPTMSASQFLAVAQDNAAMGKSAGS